MRKAKSRIGIDVGGTFTDFVLVDAATGAQTFFKEPSVPSDPSASVERGIVEVIARAGIERSDVEFILHGTTLGLNAIIQRRGAEIALVVPNGFRDILEIARSRMPNSYDLNAEKEEVLVPRDRVFEIDARIGVGGEMLATPDASALDTLAAKLRESGVSAIGVTLLHSYLYPEPERRIVAELSRRLPDLVISASADVWPESREYERTLVTLLNAYVSPLMTDYFVKLERRLKQVGIEAPLYITSSNGGTLSVETARERPIDTILSGPASGVVAAQFIASATGYDRVITFDMGGTSSDIAITRDGDPEYTTRSHVGDFPLVLPVVNVSAIGAGGGSIIWVDEHGVLKVGPGSAGADPGPVSYGRGGTDPCITDCYLALGLIEPTRFLGGRMPLDREAAIKALAKIGEEVGFTGEHAAVATADAALRVATAVMGTELRKSLAQRGEDPRSFILMPFGGAGPTHANLLAQEAGLTSMLVPLAPGTFCAMGATLADIKRDYVRSLRHPIRDDAAAGALLALALDELSGEARAWVRGEGDGLGEPAITATADLRYEGEAFDLSVVIPVGDAVLIETVRENFHREHEKHYGFRDPSSTVEIVTLRLRVTARLPEWHQRVPPVRSEASCFEIRKVFINGGYADVPVYRRHDLAPGQVINGPIVLEQEDTTTWVLPSWTLSVHANGVLIVEKTK
jgi:N-methylhydantoinase A